MLRPFEKTSERMPTEMPDGSFPLQPAVGARSPSSGDLRSRRNSSPRSLLPSGLRRGLRRSGKAAALWAGDVGSAARRARERPAPSRVSAVPRRKRDPGVLKAPRAFGYDSPGSTSRRPAHAQPQGQTPRRPGPFLACPLLDIGAELSKEATRPSGLKRSAAVETALKEYVRLRRKDLLSELPGRIHLEESWRELREAEKREPADSR